VGLSQAFALVPGISRSGMTISTGLVSGMKAEEAFRFSFLLSIPAIMGAALYKILTIDVKGALSGNISSYALGMIAAFFTGLVGLKFLKAVIKTKKLYVFAIYCIIVGSAGILFLR
jgi:undecaprenyl-diphosphatase